MVAKEAERKNREREALEDNARAKTHRHSEDDA